MKNWIGSRSYPAQNRTSRRPLRTSWPLGSARSVSWSPETILRSGIFMKLRKRRNQTSSSYHLVPNLANRLAIVFVWQLHPRGQMSGSRQIVIAWRDLKRWWWHSLVAQVSCGECCIFFLTPPIWKGKESFLLESPATLQPLDPVLLLSQMEHFEYLTSLLVL